MKVSYRVNSRWCIYTESGSTSNCEVANGKSRYWIAGQKTESGSTFIWKVRYSNGTVAEQPMTYTNWASAQPGTLNPGQQYCSVLQGEEDYKWARRSCTYSLCFVCEIYPWRPETYYDRKFNRPIFLWL